ncbi:ABC transporter ATP-binding protein [Undibacterium sp. Jales W-56]|uniref:ABC transporter ATP-binding protein n=1 Tax=Undibacterium sp. Jales W-56 TaxID=2897325 RepID=UPI0021CFFD9B|nr:ABC transporter ATP-binding protein [Undibacterium sp. Jales W-56]MCU6433247.1 ABC transporter ATP-binding protein [Undibacterium sp. Jales W-56]
MSNTSNKDIDLAIRNVTKQYTYQGKIFTAVDKVSLEVPKGAFCSILGPSGCGKTTLLRMIAGFIEPDHGDILIGNKSMMDVAPNKRPVNMIFQHLALFPMMTVGENVAYGLMRRNEKRSDILQKVKNMLGRVGLPGASDKRIDQLSGGQKQRVAIARSLILDPTLLLLDEPLGALDLKLREHMKLELKQLQAEIGTTFIYITHDQSEALVMSDFIGVMNKGRFEQLGSPQDLYYRPNSAFVASFVGNNNGLSGYTSEKVGDQYKIDVGSGVCLRAISTYNLTVRQPISVFLRPEHIDISRTKAFAKDYANQLSGKIADILFDGANSTIFVDISGTGLSLKVALPHTGLDMSLVPGEQVFLGISAEHVLAFPV